MFTNLSFDELNALVTNERSMPFEQYADMFGTNLDYTRTASTVKNLPIKEESIVWTSEPILNADGTVDKDSADYTVAGIADGINGLVIALKARKKNA